MVITVALPLVTNVPLYTSLNPSAILLTGNDSPVRIDSLSVKSFDKTIFPSADTISPSSKCIISSTTISSIGNSVSTPSRMTFALDAESFFNASIAFLLLYSWKREMPATIKIETSIMIPSLFCPTEKYIIHVISNNKNMGSNTTSFITLNNTRSSFISKVLLPFCKRLCLTCSLFNPDNFSILLIFINLSLN